MEANFAQMALGISTILFSIFVFVAIIRALGDTLCAESEYDIYMRDHDIPSRNTTDTNIHP